MDHLPPSPYWWGMQGYKLTVGADTDLLTVRLRGELYIKFDGCKLTADQFINFVRGLPDITQRIKVVRCPNITLEVINQLKGRLPALLVRLELDGKCLELERRRLPPPMVIPELPMVLW